ncbi:MAG: Uma2 family endonuclease [Anaerolineae bacterium]|nr:Uma2 family endonuclease [Anaerolineae bacterium]
MGLIMNQLTDTVPIPERQLYEWFVEQRWNEELYLALANNRNSLVDLSDGKVMIHAMLTPAHQSIVGNLYTMLRQYGERGVRGRAYTAPMPVRLWPGKFREPDLVYYRAEHLDRVGEQFGGPPDLVAEVLSPSTRGLDTGTKTEEYALAEIPEYWLLDPEAQTVTVYVLAEGRYHFVALYRPGERVCSETLDALVVQIDDLFQE